MQSKKELNDIFKVLKEKCYEPVILTIPSKTLLQKSRKRLPWWLSGEEFACQCIDMGSIPDLGKIPHAVEQLSPHATTVEPVL